MIDSKYNGMFSISKLKRIFYNSENGTTITKNIVCDDYDLKNHSVYDMEGYLIEEAGQIAYNTDFIIRLRKANILNVIDFLQFQFANTPDKDRFLDYLAFGILPENVLSVGKIGLIGKWLELKRNDLLNNNI